MLTHVLVALALSLTLWTAPTNTDPGAVLALDGVTLVDFTLPADAEGLMAHVNALSDDGRYLLYEYGWPTGSPRPDGTTSLGWSLHRRDLTTSEDIEIGVNVSLVPVMSSDGRFVAFTGPEYRVTLWDAQSDVEPIVIGNGEYLTISDDGNFVGFYNGTATLWSRSAGLKSLGGGVVPRVSADGSLVTLSRWSESTQGLRQIDPVTLATVRTLDRAHQVDPLAVSKDGRYVVGMQYGPVDINTTGYFWADMVTGRFEVLPRTFDGGCNAVAEHRVDLADDGSWIVLVTNGDNSYDNVLGPNTDTTFDARGSYFVSIGEESVDVTSASGQSITYLPPSNNCSTIAATSDGSLVAFSSEWPAGWSPPPFTGWGAPADVKAASTPAMSKIVLASRPGPRRLTVSKTGTGSGRVISAPSGIDCGSTCSRQFTNGTTVELTVAPSPGSVFSGWSGACSGGGACSVTMTTAKNVTATFSTGSAGSSFRPITPARYLDTRSTGTTLDNLHRNTGTLLAGHTYTLPAAGRGAIPADATAVAMNITAVTPSGSGYLTVWPCGTTRPNTSSLNYRPGITLANAVTAPTGTSGNICIYTSTTTHVIADISGYHPTGSSFRPITPARYLDTRSTGTTLDNLHRNTGTLLAGHTYTLPAAGRGAIPADATAVAMNITAVTPSGSGYLTVWPCGTTRPNTSSLNYRPGITLANAVAAPTGTSGNICIYTSTTTHVIADISGYHPTGSSFRPITPARYLDTRSTGTTLDNLHRNTGTLLAGHTYTLPAAGRGAIPADATAVAMNITAVTPSGSGYLTVWPCGTTRPNTSSLNYRPGITLANAVTAPTGTSGNICIYTSTTTHVIADISGYHPAD